MMAMLHSFRTHPTWTAWVVVGALVPVLAGCAVPQSKPTPPQEPVDYVWPPPPEPARIKYIRSFRAKTDVEAEAGPSLADTILGAETKRRAIRLLKPYGVYADKDGRVLVADTGWGKVLVFDAANNKFSMWGEEGKGGLTKPLGITGDSTGRYYVTDGIEKRVVVFDRDGRFLSAMGKKGDLENPAGIAINENLGRVYVVDAKLHHVAVFDTNDGTLIKTIGKRGREPGEFNFPTNIAIDSKGHLYVVDGANFRVQVLDPEGKVLTTIGQLGDGPGTFSRPKGIAVDSDGHVYVTDAAFNNFQIFKTDGKLLLYVGVIGIKPGQFWLPAGAYIDHKDRIYVADQYNFRVQVFQYLKGNDEQVPAPTKGAPKKAKS